MAEGMGQRLLIVLLCIILYRLFVCLFL